MYPKRNPAAAKQRRSQPKKWGAPVAGWISNRSLAYPGSVEGQGAAVLDNFFPKASSVTLRRGKQLYATLGDGTLPCLSLFTYVNGLTQKMFAATETTIYDVSTVIFPESAVIVTEDGDDIVTETGDVFGWSSTEGLDITSLGPFTGGNWITAQFATTGGVYLIGVNGMDEGFLYDGQDFWPYISGGFTYLPYDTETAPFTVGEIVTGDTSGATGLVWRVDANRLVLRDVVYTPETWTLAYVGGIKSFTVGSTLRGDTSIASGRISQIVEGDTTWTLPYDGGTGAFVTAEIITGGTSGATGEIVAVAGTTADGTLTIKTLAGTFVDNEALTGSTAGGADVNGEASAPILSGTITLTGLNGTFIHGETVNDGSGGQAKAQGSTIFVGGGSFEDNELLTGSLGGGATVGGLYSSAAPGIEFPDGLTTANMSYVWVYKNRLWFAEKDTMNAWYLSQVDSLGGEVNAFPLAGVFGKGGTLLFGSLWSVDSSNGVDLAEQNIFVSTEGEVAVYQGINPEQADTWNKVGVYQIGRPLGNRAHFKGGGDIAIATSVGLVPLSKAINLDITALSVATVSYKIADAWSEALTMRGMEGWQCQIWPELKQAVVSPPNIIGADSPVLFISNTETGAWTRYTGWEALCMCVFRGQMYFGSPNGQIFIANVSGRDNQDAYTGVIMPLFEDMGTAGALKVGEVGRAVVRANTIINDTLDMVVDFDLAVPAAPDASVLATGNLWDLGVWGQSVWSAGIPSVINQEWQSTGGMGYAASIAYQVTSGSVAPLDADLIQIEFLYTTAELVS